MENREIYYIYIHIYIIFFIIYFLYGTYLRIFLKIEVKPKKFSGGTGCRGSVQGAWQQGPRRSALPKV